MIHYALPPSLDNDIFCLEQEFAEFRAGRLHETVFTAKRVKMGVYLERDRLTYMCRIRCSGNIITPKQLAGVASLANIYGNGTVHVTTRAEVQLYRIEERDVIPVLRKLKEIGLSCKGGGGNTVRNLIANHDSGISTKEVFDVQPCLLALAERLLRESDSWELPRKMKIAFSSLAEEAAFGFVQDIGFAAHLNIEGKQGFRVYVGGGLGAHPKVGVQLHEFVHQEEVYNVVRAVKNMFHLYGNRRNKHRNRIKFLLHDDLGTSAFRTYYRQELNKVLERGYAKLNVGVIDNSENAERDIALAPQHEESDDFRIWKKRHVARQRQKGLCRIKLPVFSGNLHAEDCSALEKFLRPFGENTLRLGTDQNLYLVNIPEVFL
ncbi:MAG: nitrite/sulfite reductase, partial [Candidatus Electrothrix sp. AR5]|nr:nitrite/sulfite reductase [Candidatus Electrothrix sp. AR5]